MSERVTMPALGESVTEGTVTRWLKEVGDSVAIDEPLLEVSTDKVDTEIPSPVAGTLQEILVAEDETVPVGTDLAVVGSGVSADAGSAVPPAAAAPPAPEQTDPAAAAQTPPAEAPPAQASAESAPAAGTPSEGGTTVTMPALGESVTEGTVTRWLKAEGEQIEVDEPLLEVSTDKVDTEIPSPFAGTLQQILVHEDETVAVGTALAVIGAGSFATAPAEPEAITAPVPVSPGVPVAPAPQVAPAAVAVPVAVIAGQTAATSAARSSAPPVSGSYLTPLVRKLAAEQHVDLARLTGTGVGGRIRKEDVLEWARQAAQAAKAAAADAAAASAAAAAAGATRAAATVSSPAPGAKSHAMAVPAAVSPLRGTTEKMSRLRKLVADRLVESLHTSAQLTTVVEVDVSKVARLRAQAKLDFQAREGVNLTFLPFFALAAVEALKTYPKINASIDGNQVIYHASENLGIAVDTERGLVVPVIKDAGDLNLAGIARKIVDLASRTRANKVGPDDLTGGTFTITNTGSGGALIDTPIVALPQVAILGTGAIVKRPVIAKDADGADIIAIRSMIYLSLSYDHRLVDGGDAARYLTAVKNRIEEGAFESELGL